MKGFIKNERGELMTFFARFSNIHLEVSLSMIYVFLKNVRETYDYKWVRKHKSRVLIIYGENEYELPFTERESKVYLSIQELTTSEKTFALLFNQLLFEARKHKLGIKNIKTKKQLSSTAQDLIPVEIDKDYLEKKNEFIIQKEIDYLLMDLYEALQRNDEDTVALCKKKLEEMVQKKTGSSN